jgi:hypothetical protein
MDVSLNMKLDKVRDPQIFLHDVPKGTVPVVVKTDSDSRSTNSYSCWIGTLEIIVFETEEE